VDGLSVRVAGVSKAFGMTQALDDVSFSVTPGSVHTLLGGNGSGKSTLIKILAGVESADAGELEVGGTSFDLPRMTPAEAAGAGLHFLHQQRSTYADLSVSENLAIGRGYPTGRGFRIGWRRLRRWAAELLERFDVPAHPDQPLGELGPATQTMVGIAGLLHDQEGASDGVLVLDEPTAALPAAEVDLLLDALTRYARAGQTILYVTHRLEEVTAIADKATLLRDGRLVDTVEPRSLTHDRLVELMMGQAVDRIARSASDRTEGAVVVELEGVSAGAVQGIDLQVRAGEIVGVAGLLGSGRSSLLKALFGLVPLSAGRILVDGVPRALRAAHAAMDAGIAYVPEDRLRDGAFPQLSLRENVSLTVLERYWRHGVIQRRAERHDASVQLEEFMVKPPLPEAPLASLSGGNQQKVVLARSLRSDPRLLLLDEPSQGVDVRARVEIYEVVKRAVDAGTAVMLASSDFDELAALCDRVVVLRKGRIAGELQGPELDNDALNRLAHADVAA
jgi:ribose transport system ATP-binding protein